MNVRKATEKDATEILQLIAELGYSPSIDSFLRQFSIYRTSESTLVLVATEANSACAIGVLSASLIPLFHEPGYLGRITALVVTSAARGKGIGAALVLSAEEWFRSKNCGRVEVTSGEGRLHAHEFYQARGFTAASQRFIKRYAS